MVLATPFLLEHKYIVYCQNNMNTYNFRSVSSVNPEGVEYAK